MGNIQSIDLSHIRIYKNLLSIQNPVTRAEMIQTVLTKPEYIKTAKELGIYGDLLDYSAKVFRKQIPPLLPYEEKAVYKQHNHTSLINKQVKSHNERIGKANSEEKAIGYFQACLEVLEVQEEVALNENSLKIAYKKAVLKHHPDKGGSEKEFEKVTRAYAYLGEILRRIHGGRTVESKVEEPTVLKDSRASESKQWIHLEPVKLNPKKLDINAFNKMFEQTRIPDPEEDGYGDWLKNDKENATAPVFSGKFNRDIFNKMFEDDVKKKNTGENYIIQQPQSMIMAPTLGVELGRDKPSSYTAAYNSDLNFTDLKQAYTTEANFSKQVVSVNVNNRNFESYKDDRAKAPQPLNNSEIEEIQRSELMMKQREEQRRIRAAQEEINATNYFERMKQLVITDKFKP